MFSDTVSDIASSSHLSDDGGGGHTTIYRHKHCQPTLSPLKCTKARSRGTAQGGADYTNTVTYTISWGVARRPTHRLQYRLRRPLAQRITVPSSPAAASSQFSLLRLLSPSLPPPPTTQHVLHKQPHPQVTETGRSRPGDRSRTMPPSRRPTFGSKLNDFSRISGHSRPHLQVPSVRRY